MRLVLFRKLLGLIPLLVTPLITAAELSIPAFTAYMDPDPEGAEVRSKSGITRWKNPANKVVWFGEFLHSGSLTGSVVLAIPDGVNLRYRLTVGSESRETEARGEGSRPITASFGHYPLTSPGYQRFTLECLTTGVANLGDVQSLLLSGPACEGAHFNLKSRRNAASVHLGYPVPKETKVAAFYCEMTGVEDPLYTYYMACGWHRGYFGMQVNSARERRIIFSVWDSGNEAVDRKKVAEVNRVQLIAKGDGVVADDFGNEGTGGHSHWVYGWKTGETQRFLVTAQPVSTNQTVYSGFFYENAKHQWKLISSWRAPHDGGWLRGLYSFSENFGGSTGHLRRKALYGNQQIRTDAGQWIELTTAKFSHDPTGKEDRLDRFGGAEAGQFFLSHGGFVPGRSAAGDLFHRAPLGKPPEVEGLPPLPSPLH